MKNYYVFQHGCLDADDKTLRFQGNETRKIPVEQIDSIHLLAGFTITSGALRTASDAEFPIHIYGYYGNYIGSFTPKNGPQSSERLLAQLRSHDDATRRLAIAKSMVKGSIESYNSLLKALGEDALDTSVADLSMNIEELRLSEARMRKELYAALDSHLSEYYALLGRTRRPPGNPGNCLLSFWNGLVYAQTLTAIYRSGLDPRIGYLHGDIRATNPLALDLAELFKCYFSEAQLVAISRSGRRPKWFTEVGEGVYLNETGRKEATRIFDEMLSRQVRHNGLDRYLPFREVMVAEAYKLEKAMMGIKPYAATVVNCTLSSPTTCQ